MLLIFLNWYQDANQDYNLENILEGEVILINKPYKWSSFDVVKKVRNRLCKNFNLKKIKVSQSYLPDKIYLS